MKIKHNALKFNEMRKQIPILVFTVFFISVSLQAQTLNPLSVSGLEEDSRFGQAVEISGNTSFVAAPFKNVDGSAQAGAVYVFEKSTDWAHVEVLTAPEGRPFDNFGYSLTSSGNMLAVGAPGKSSGVVYIYENQGSSWVHTQVLTPAMDTGRFANPMQFGFAIDMTENYLFVSAPYYLKSASETDASVFVFERDPEGWKFKQRLNHPGGQTSSLFGHAIAADGERLIVGSPKSNGGADLSGAAFLYERSGETWEFKFKFLYPFSISHERFGLSVGIHDDQVIIGSMNHVFDESEGPVGTAHIYVKAGASWFHTGTLSSPFTGRNDRYGERVTIRGDYAVVSAGRSDHTGKVNAGSVHVFKQENGFWQEKYRLIPDTAFLESHMYFGGSFSLSDEHLLIGSHLEDNFLNDSGNSYVHELNQTVATSEPIQNGYALYAASPNPFHDQTTITFDLPVSADIIIEAFDLNGNLVEVIEKGNYPAGMNQSIIWHPVNPVPGMYFIQLRAGNHISTVKTLHIQ